MTVENKEEKGLTRRSALATFGGIAVGAMLSPSILSSYLTRDITKAYAAGGGGGKRANVRDKWVTSSSEDVASLQNRIAELESQISQLESDKASLQSIIDGNNTKIANLTAELEKNTVAVGATAPTPVVTGKLWIDTSAGGVLKYYDGSQWQYNLSVWGV